MINQIITHQAVAVAAVTAQVFNFSFNVAGAHSSLSIITIQQAQSSHSETLESEVNLADVNAILLSLSDIKNLIKLKKIFNMKLTNLIFCE